MSFYEFFHSITNREFGGIVIILMIFGWRLDNIVDTITKNRKK